MSARRSFVLLLALLAPHVYVAVCPLPARAAPPRADVEGIEAVKGWAAARVGEAEASFAGRARMPSPGFWGSEVVYEVMVDRFNDGDLGNDGANLPRTQIVNGSGSNLYDLQVYRHGGDLQGIVDRLDYLVDLGITALWITPVFAHDGGYHGYCTTDFTRVDPGYGSNELLRELVAQAHRRGIRVVLDVVVNHMCDPATYYERAPSHYACANDLSARNASGGASESPAQGALRFSDAFFGPLRSAFFFNRCGANSLEDMQGTGPASVYGDFTAGMFDFETRNDDFQQVFTDLHKYWVAYADVDGFRVDAAKHVSEAFLAYFSTQLRAYAQSLGKQNFYLVGEIAGPQDWMARGLGNQLSDPQNPAVHGNVPASLTSELFQLRSLYLAHPVSRFGGLNAVYDFPTSGTTREILRNERPTRALEDYRRSDGHALVAAQSDSRLNWINLEIHDWLRFVAGPHRYSQAKSQLGVALLPMLEGIPIVYYGLEQGFNADCHWNNMNAGAANADLQRLCSGPFNDALSRQDMFASGPWRLGSSVPSLNSLAYIGRSTPAPSPHWTADPMLRRDHEVYQLARRAIAVRKSCNPLRYGFQVPRWAVSDSQGLLAFSRIDNGQEAVVAANTAAYPIALPALRVENASNPSPGRRYKNLFNGYQTASTGRQGNDSYLYFGGLQIPGNSVMVFLPEDRVGDWDSRLGVHLCR